MTPSAARVRGVASYVPERVLSNADLERMVDTNDEWIRERSGIRERRIAAPDETVASMAAAATERLLRDEDVSPAEVDVIVFSTSSWDQLLPSSAASLQALIGAPNAAVFDLSAACSGWLYALAVANGLVGTGQARTVLVVGADRMSSIVNYEDRATCVLFGDAAGASLVTAAEGSDSRILSTYMKSDGTLAKLLHRPGPFPPTAKAVANGEYFVHMVGREVFKHAVRMMADACQQALDRAGLTIDDVDLLVPHQANSRIIEATAKHAGIAMDQVFVNVDRYGNTSSATIPVALDEAVRGGKLKPGMVVLLAAFGAGFTWGSVALRW